MGGNIAYKIQPFPAGTSNFTSLAPNTIGRWDEFVGAYYPCYSENCLGLFPTNEMNQAANGTYPVIQESMAGVLYRRWGNPNDTVNLRGNLCCVEQDPCAIRVNAGLGAFTTADTGLHVVHGREAGPREAVNRGIVLRTVHLGNGDQVRQTFLLHLLTDLDVFRFQLLAVTAPRSVHFEQDVLFSEEAFFFQVLTDNHLHRLVVGFRHRLRLQVRRDLTRFNLLHVLEERFSGHFTIVDEVLLVTSLLLDNDLRELSDTEHGFQNLTEFSGVGLSDAVLFAEFLGNFSSPAAGFFDLFLDVILGHRQQNPDEAVATVDELGEGITVQSTVHREAVGLEELFVVGFGGFQCRLTQVLDDHLGIILLHVVPGSRLAVGLRQSSEGFRLFRTVHGHGEVVSFLRLFFPM